MPAYVTYNIHIITKLFRTNFFLEESQAMINTYDSEGNAVEFKWLLKDTNTPPLS